MLSRIKGIFDLKYSSGIPCKVLYIMIALFSNLWWSVSARVATLLVLHPKETEINFSMMGGRGEGTSRKQGGEWRYSYCFMLRKAGYSLAIWGSTASYFFNFYPRSQHIQKSCWLDSSPWRSSPRKTRRQVWAKTERDQHHSPRKLQIYVLWGNWGYSTHEWHQ